MSSTSSSSTSFSLKIRMALIGSPTYFGFANFCVFTSPPSCSSRQGMTRCLSISQAEEVSYHRHPEPVALFRVKLDAVHAAVSESRGKGIAVVRRRQDVLLARAHGMEGMREIEALLGA